MKNFAKALRELVRRMGAAHLEAGMICWDMDQSWYVVITDPKMVLVTPSTKPDHYRIVCHLTMKELRAVMEGDFGQGVLF